MLETFCVCDDFCKTLPNNLIADGNKKTRRRSGKMSLSEIMTILVHFQNSNYRNFKAFYLEDICQNHRSEFPSFVSYPRMVRLIPRALIALVKLMMFVQGKPTGISIIDSTSINVCHNKRISRNRVFQGLAERGKTTMGWFFGFKLHLVINHKGEILSFTLTKGNVDDRKPVSKLVKELWGKLFGDRGYISTELQQNLAKLGISLITSVRKNMKNKLMPLLDKILLRKRFLIETINDQLKNEMQIEHTRHRSPLNFITHLISGLIAYSLKPKKPSLHLDENELKLILA